MLPPAYLFRVTLRGPFGANEADQDLAIVSLAESGHRILGASNDPAYQAGNALKYGRIQLIGMVEESLRASADFRQTTSCTIAKVLRAAFQAHAVQVRVEWRQVDPEASFFTAPEEEFSFS